MERDWITNLKLAFETEYVGDDPPPAADPASIGKETPPPPQTPPATPKIDENFESDSEVPVTLTQKQLSAIMGNVRQKFRKQAEQVTAELEKLSQQANMTKEEKERLGKVLEQSRSQFTSELERQQAEATKLSKELEEHKTKTSEEIKAWRQRFELTMIDNGVAAAAAECGVFKPKQIRDMLDKYLMVEQAVDEKGGPLEEFKVVVNTKGEDGKPVKLPVLDFLKRMDQSGEHPNLFNHNMKGGLNATGGSGAAGGNKGEPPADVEELKEWLAVPENRKAWLERSTK